MDVLVWVESEGETLRKISLELLSEAARRCPTGGRVLAAAFGEGAARAVEANAALADLWFVGPDGPDAAYDAPSWAAALGAAADDGGAALVLGGATVRGREVFSTLAAVRGWGYAAGIVRLEGDGTALRAVRPVLGGRALQGVPVAGSPFLATVRPNSFAFDAGLPARAGARREKAAGPPARGAATFSDPQKAAAGRPALADAEIVVAGGRGLKSAANFHLLEELADALGAAVGASRAVVDAGWRDLAEQVGKSGITVAPRLYVAAGISGAIHHTMGMDASKVVVAVDKDPEAPIFKAADYGIAGDALAVLPALTEAVRERS